MWGWVNRDVQDDRSLIGGTGDFLCLKTQMKKNEEERTTDERWEEAKC